MPDWDTIFREQGRVFTTPHPEMQRIAELCQERAARRVLDLGCGTGRHLVYLSNLGFDVYGFDSSPLALSIAQEWLDEEGLNAELIEHRMECTFPYEDEFFDAVISIQVIHHNLMRNIRNTVSEIERVLKQGGVVFFTFPILSRKLARKEDDWDLEQVEYRTFIPRKGPESGIPHHYFTTREIPDVFRAFEIFETFFDATNHQCILGIKK
jgi:SAM-dependent methyltransferase